MKTSNLFKIILFGPILIVSQLLFGQLYTPSGTVNAVTNGSTTNVGIGTSTPTQSIHVGIGNIQLPIGSSSSTGSIIFGGDI
ncbi:MAG: hypothetical protein K2X86_01425 [Cytophagaceae bacterium]|nr:hypothetical protein [Cytophagaceae bacterium]